MGDCRDCATATPTAHRWPGAGPPTVASPAPPTPCWCCPPITSPGCDYRVVNVEVQQQLSGSLLNWHHRMLTSRRLLPALRYGDMVMIESGHPSVLCYARSCQERSEGEETLPAMTVIVAANLSGTGASTRLDLSQWQGHRMRETLWGCEFAPASPEWFAYLHAYGFFWWLVGE